MQQWNVCASEQRILSQLQQWLRAAACQTEEGVITTDATIRHANHIHELITGWDGHNGQLLCTLVHIVHSSLMLTWQFFFGDFYISFAP